MDTFSSRSYVCICLYPKSRMVQIPKQSKAVRWVEESKVLIPMPVYMGFPSCNL